MWKWFGIGMRHQRTWYDRGLHFVCPNMRASLLLSPLCLPHFICNPITKSININAFMYPPLSCSHKREHFGRLKWFFFLNVRNLNIYIFICMFVSTQSFTDKLGGLLARPGESEIPKSDIPWYLRYGAQALGVVAAFCKYFPIRFFFHNELTKIAFFFLFIQNFVPLFCSRHFIWLLELLWCHNNWFSQCIVRSVTNMCWSFCNVNRSARLLYVHWFCTRSSKIGRCSTIMVSCCSLLRVSCLLFYMCSSDKIEELLLRQVASEFRLISLVVSNWCPHHDFYARMYIYAQLINFHCHVL